MKLKNISRYLLAILLISSCTSGTVNKNNLTGTWRLYDIELLNAEDNDQSFSEMAASKRIVKDGIALSFFEDGTYTKISGQNIYNNGSWKLLESDKIIGFTIDDRLKEQDSITISKTSSGKQMLSITVVEKNMRMKFIKEAESLKDFKNDPFYASNNQWRIKPAHTETEAHLKERFLNYIKHLSFILKSAKDRKQDIVSFEFSQGPIKIYNGGIGIHSYSIVPDSWKANFYDDADALKAYTLYDDYLTTNSYKGAGTGEWIEDDYNILLSIYAGMKQ